MSEFLIGFIAGINFLGMIHSMAENEYGAVFAVQVLALLCVVVYKVI